MFKRNRPGLRSDIRGNVTVIAALCAVPMLLSVFGVLELSGASNERQKLQEAVDAGALAGAGQLSIANTNGSTGPGSTAVAVARQVVTTAHITSAVVYTPTVSADRASITLEAVADHKSLAGFMGMGDGKIIVRATAETLGSVPLCILQTASDGSINVGDTARIRASGCAVYANKDITVNSGAMIQATSTQAVGKVTGPVSPIGHSGALPVTDPFGDMNLTPPTACPSSTPALTANSGVVALQSGVHCQNIVMSGTATLQLAPGTHYFQGNLSLAQNTTLVGDNVTLVFGGSTIACPANNQGNQNQQGNQDTNSQGEDSACGKTFSFADNGFVRLTASRSGTFAGFLIITDRSNRNTFAITSGNVGQLLGTIYIPNSTLLVTTAGNVAQNSAWSVIVAKSLSLKKNPVLVINTNYTGSGVPVPNGVGPHSTAPKLAR